jgi:hypothetical protein
MKRGLDMLTRATDMGNQYAPFYAAMLYLKGDDELPKDPRRALSLLELSANRGNEFAYLHLAYGYRDGAFTKGKPDLKKAYFNAAIAERWRADKAEEVKAAIAEKLDPATRDELDRQVELYIKQNGK